MGRNQESFFRCRLEKFKTPKFPSENSWPLVIILTFSKIDIDPSRTSNELEIDFFKGEMHKKAYKHIWLPFFQFSTNFNETLSKCFFFRGRLNETFKSDLTLFFFHRIQGGTKGKKNSKTKKSRKKAALSKKNSKKNFKKKYQ